MSLRKIFTTLFVLAVNFYFVSFALGIAAGLYTNEQGSIPLLASVLLSLVSLAICIAYQATRKHIIFYSPGELAIGNYSKTDILNQHSSFSISRIPLFLLLFLTLALPGNFLDGLSEGAVFTLPHLLTLSVLYGSFYLGVTRFFSQPTFLAAALFSGGLLLSSMLSRSLSVEGNVISKVFLLMAGLWLVAWLVYRRFPKPLSTN